MKKLIIGISAEGSVNLLRGQLRHFRERGYDTYLMAPYSERSADFCKAEGCTHLVLPVKRDISLTSDLINLIRVIKIFLEVKPDVINFGTPKISLLGMIAGKILGIKRRIYTCRGFRYEHERGVKRKILITMEKITATCAHRVVCISNSVKDLGVRDNIFKEKKAIVIHKGSSNGVDLKLFSRESIDHQEREGLRDELALTGKFVFGFIGRIVDRKGLRELLTAFDQLYQQNPSIALLVVGPFEHGQLIDKALPDDLEKHPGVVYAGRKPQDDVPKYLALVDVFVLPAWWEGFGNVLIQSAAMGIPVISTYATGTSDAVGNNFNGVLVPPKDVSSLRDAMLKLYSNKTLWQQYGQNGFAWARNFDSMIIWDGLEKLYSDAL